MSAKVSGTFLQLSRLDPYVDPELPGWLPEITLRQLTIRNATVDLKFWREDEHTRWAAEVKAGDIEIQEKSWQPWH